MKVDREQALDVALGQIERNFGKGAVMKMSDQAHVSVGAISTGSLSLDLALGIGGLPRGRIVEIFGPESSGKTTLVYHVIAEAQRRGGICAFIDAEHAMDPTYAKRIGVNIDELLVSQPDTGEQALEITELLIRSGALAVVAIDSVAALTPKAEIEGEMGDSHVGLQARLMSQALRKLAGTLNRTDTICIFTNQLREKIGVMFGKPETTPGGRALKFYASVRLDIRRIETLKDGVEAIGNRVRVKVAKNKVAPPFKQAEFDIMYGEGISWEGTVLETGLDRKIVQKSGSYFSFGDERLGQGRQNATAFLKEHPDLVQQILQGIQANDVRRPDRLGPPAAHARGRRRAPAHARRGRRGREPSPQRPPRRPRRDGSGPARHGARRRAARPRARRARRRAVADACPRRPSSARGLAVGTELDRPRARTLRRELRRIEALAVATGALASRDRSTAGVAARLERRGVAPGERASVAGGARAGGLPRRRPLRRVRATALAARGYGDEAIRFDLEREGVAADRSATALGRVAPEPERAAEIVARSGRSAKTARRLAAKGFAAETVESLFE